MICDKLGCIGSTCRPPSWHALGIQPFGKPMTSWVNNNYQVQINYSFLEGIIIISRVYEGRRLDYPGGWHLKHGALTLLILNIVKKYSGDFEMMGRGNVCVAL